MSTFPPLQYLIQRWRATLEVLIIGFTFYILKRNFASCNQALAEAGFGFPELRGDGFVGPVLAHLLGNGALDITLAEIFSWLLSISIGGAIIVITHLFCAGLAQNPNQFVTANNMKVILAAGLMIPTAFALTWYLSL